MKRTLYWAIILCLPMTFGCQRLLDQEGDFANQQQTVPEDAPDKAEFVVSKDGSSYNISCLRGVADQVKQDGIAAAAGCRMGSVAGKTISRSVREGRGYWDNWNWYGGYWNYWYVYPPTYYNGSNYFCSFIFGSDIDSDNFNCYGDFFGFDPDYDDTFNNGCFECLYRPNPQRCRQRRGCWNYGNWYYPY